MMRGGKFRGLLLAMRFESGEAGMIGSLVGVSRRFGGSIILLSRIAGKRCWVSDKAKVIKGQNWG